MNAWISNGLRSALVLAGAVAFPVNRWLIARGKGHAVVHAHHGEVDLTGQLSNLSTALASLFALPLPRLSDRNRQASSRPAPAFQRRRHVIIRNAIVTELTAADDGLRMKDLRHRVEVRLGEPVASARFRDYVNAQSKGVNPLLERVSYGMYRLR